MQFSEQYRKQLRQRHRHYSWEEDRLKADLEMFSEIQEEITVSGENKYATKAGESVLKGLQKSTMSSISTPKENLTNTVTAVSDAAFHESLHCDSNAAIGESDVCKQLEMHSTIRAQDAKHM